MRLSDKALDDLRDIYHDEFGKDISRDEANEIGTRLLALFALISRPPPSANQTLHSPED